MKLVLGLVVVSICWVTLVVWGACSHAPPSPPLEFGGLVGYPPHAVWLSPQPIIPQRGQVLMWDGKVWRPVTLKLVCTPAGHGSAVLNCTAVLL